jgi:hypothetical protein
MLDIPSQNQILISTKMIMVFFKPYFFHAKEVNISLIRKSKSILNSYVLI